MVGTLWITLRVIAIIAGIIIYVASNLIQGDNLRHLRSYNDDYHKQKLDVANGTLKIDPDNYDALWQKKYHEGEYLSRKKKYDAKSKIIINKYAKNRMIGLACILFSEFAVLYIIGKGLYVALSWIASQFKGFFTTLRKDINVLLKEGK